MFLCAHGTAFSSRIHYLSGLQHLVREQYAYRTMYEYTDTEILLYKEYNASSLNCVFLAVCAVTAPGNAPTKAALVREMHSECTNLHVSLVNEVLGC